MIRRGRRRWRRRGSRRARIAIKGNIREACRRLGYRRVQKVYSQGISSAVIPILPIVTSTANLPDLGTTIFDTSYNADEYHTISQGMIYETSASSLYH